MALAQALHQKKFPAFVITPCTDKYYRVHVGPTSVSEDPVFAYVARPSRVRDGHALGYGLRSGRLQAGMCLNLRCRPEGRRYKNPRSVSSHTDSYPDTQSASNARHDLEADGFKSIVKR